MRHPIEKYNVHQAEVLASLPEDQREYMARMFRIGNASYCYYQRANELSVLKKGEDLLPTSPVETVEKLLDWLHGQIDNQTETRSARELLSAYFEEYLAGLSHEGLRRTMQLEGMEKAARSLPFRRYLLERHDIGMNEFMRQHLSKDDYAFHIEAGRASE